MSICHYCDQPAVKLCDYRMPRVPGRQHTTCDRPLCEEHATQVGSMHLSYQAKGGGRRGRWDTIDHCPEHAAEPREATA